MSVVSVGEKRVREERGRDDVVIISNMGDERPDMLADCMTTLCVASKANVSSYVCVPNFGEPIFLANSVGEGGHGNYVQKMIPNTECLQGMAGDVMILFCHGAPCKMHLVDDKVYARWPSYVCFSEAKSVKIDGERVSVSPFESRIFACSEYRDGDQTFTKPRNGVSLSQVVHGAQLVMLMCCHGRHVMTEYASEASEASAAARPDFVVFLKEGIVFDTSVNIFIVLLMQAIEWYTSKEETVKTTSWHELIRRSVCQVILWVKEESAESKGGAEAFYTFLALRRCIYAFNKNTYRILGNGSPTYFNAEIKDKQELLDDLRSVTLMLWDDGSRATTRATTHGRVVKGYDVIDQSSSAKDLREWMLGTTALPASTRRPQAGQGVELLLLQLQGLLRADCSI